jgi:hypothetical protein
MNDLVISDVRFCVSYKIGQRVAPLDAPAAQTAGHPMATREKEDRLRGQRDAMIVCIARALRRPRILRSVLHRPDGSQAKQIVVGRDQRKVHDLSSGGKEPICGIALWKQELLGDQHDLVGQRRFPHGPAQHAAERSRVAAAGGAAGENVNVVNLEDVNTIARAQELRSGGKRSG